MTDKRITWSDIFEMELRLWIMEIDLVLKEKNELERRN